MHKTWKHVRLPRGSCWWDTTEDWQHIRAKRKAPKRKKRSFLEICMHENTSYVLSARSMDVRNTSETRRICANLGENWRSISTAKCKVPTVDSRHSTHTSDSVTSLEIISRFVDYYYLFKSKLNSIRVMVIGVPFPVNTSDENKVFGWRRFRLLIHFGILSSSIMHKKVWHDWWRRVFGAGILSDNWAERAPDIIFKTSNVHNQHKTYHFHDSTAEHGVG